LISKISLESEPAQLILKLLNEFASLWLFTIFIKSLKIDL